MKKIITYISLLFILSNSVYGNFGDVLSVIKKTTLVKNLADINSDSIATLKDGYVILDYGLESGNWKKVRLTDGKIGYVSKSDIGLNKSSKYEITGNFGYTLSNIDLKKLPSDKSNNGGLLAQGVKFKVIHPNYLNKQWVKVKILDGSSKLSKGYIKKENLSVYCGGKGLDNILGQVFEGKVEQVSIPGINDSSSSFIVKDNSMMGIVGITNNKVDIGKKSYCNRLVASESFELNSANEGNQYLEFNSYNFQEQNSNYINGNDFSELNDYNFQEQDFTNTNGNNSSEFYNYDNDQQDTTENNNELDFLDGMFEGEDIDNTNVNEENNELDFLDGMFEGEDIDNTYINEENNEELDFLDSLFQ